MVRDAGGLTNAFPESGDLTVGGRVIAAAPGAWDELAAIVGA
jgi:myo-inositol-1(or 4)-monophosphatase